ncbi:neurotransmitter-gated ion-channel ligand binding domain-containing protein [Ditylenchus destructor]|uniref:Neurotransmitter-gated ion-channel ligand binding domain-containing protein n=1 Tax=Ditylenchus destructor TaxID=166010 RepID=A0AAD4MZI9_9BILA|nr:neurotransmitter-gated ion-channel ligand binding domain-containing protein [Ditylenchus destructor]
MTPSVTSSLVGFVDDRVVSCRRKSVVKAKRGAVSRPSQSAYLFRLCIMASLCKKYVSCGKMTTIWRQLVKWLTIFLLIEISDTSRYADQLYEDLMYFYNKNVRPVKNTSEPLRVKFGASLIRIIDVV